MKRKKQPTQRNSFREQHSQLKTGCKKPRLFFLSSSPPTKGSSGYQALKAQKSPLVERLSQNYDIESFCWTKRCDQTLGLKQVYLMDGFPIMLNLIRAFLRERFDAVVTTGIPTIESIPSFLIAKVTGIPVIIKESHWYWPNTFSSKFSWSINKLMNSNSTLVVCSGKKSLQLLALHRHP